MLALARPLSCLANANMQDLTPYILKEILDSIQRVRSHSILRYQAVSENIIAEGIEWLVGKRTKNHRPG